ncbi:MAG: DUF3596 domain-containing protein [Burkholderiaceae bacterium]
MGRTGNDVEIHGKSIRLTFRFEGKRVRERLKMNGVSMPATAVNLKFATRLAVEIRAAIANGTFTWAKYFPESKHSLEAATKENNSIGFLFDTWLDTQGNLSAASKNQYATAARFWKRLLGEATPVADITHKTIAAKIGKYPWPSAKTHNNYLIALRGTLALEYRGARTMENPVNGIENMVVVKKLPDPLSATERDKMLADIHQHYDERIYAYFLFQFFTGMRPEEAIALRWSDVDLDNKTIRVQRVRTFKGSERDGSKTHSERDVGLLPQALAALNIMRKHTYMQQVERKKDHDTAADIFQNPVTGRAWHDERSQRDHYWKPSMKRCKLRWRTAYNTRHTFASAALMTGAKPAYIAAQLGHSLKMLLERYAKWMPGDDNGSSQAHLEMMMGGKKQGPTNPMFKTDL